MKQILTLLLALSISLAQAQFVHKFNLGFEQQHDPSSLSNGWFKWGTYSLEIDTISHSGDQSGKIISDEAGRKFGSIAYRIPARYKGKTIRLEGYMKIENVVGNAGLLLRLDGEAGTLEFDNMHSRQIAGTKDWQQYSITLPYPEDAEMIFVAGILSGKGTAWFDDFTLTIDGQDVQTLKEVERVIPKAEMDKEYDSGSSIEITDVSPNKIENLELLGRVWGLMKYHHPEVSKGNYNWDFELFRMLPDYLNIEDRGNRDHYLITWIDSYGDLKKCKKCVETREDVFLKPDSDWISQQSTPLKEKLQSIYDNRHQGRHHYIGYVANVKNPKFKNEDAYEEMTYPDDGYRLLAVYRYWNIIHYYFPYRHLMDEDWNMTMKAYIPKFLKAEDELQYELAAIEMIGQVKDTHANVWAGADKVEEWKGKYHAPVYVSFIEDQLVITDYYNPELQGVTGLEIGDVITKVNGKEIQTIIEEVSNYYPASNRPTRLRNISRDILRSDSEIIELSYIRDKSEGEKTQSLKLYPKDRLNLHLGYYNTGELCYHKIEDDIGYITLASIKDEDISEIKKTFIDTKGIIIDIRNYPSAFVPFKLGSYFMTSPTPFAKFTTGNIDNPGEFAFTKDITISNDKNPYQGKVVVILNELSQSQSEYTAMAFRAAPNTIVIGSTTAGADGNISPFYLPGGLRTVISGIGVYYPDGTETQRVGIVPDIEVKPTIAGLKAGKDELLEQAIQIIRED